MVVCTIDEVVMKTGYQARNVESVRSPSVHLNSEGSDITDMSFRSGLFARCGKGPTSTTKLPKRLNGTADPMIGDAQRYAGEWFEGY